MTYAYCYRSGLVEFGDQIPDGALPLDKGRGKKWRSGIEVKCRLAYDGETHLVPGIPEAETDKAAYEAWSRFRKWIADCKAKATGAAA
jgi:hypothetical protein